MSTRAIADGYIARNYGIPGGLPPIEKRNLVGPRGLEYTSGETEDGGKQQTSTDALGQALKFIPTDVVTAYTLLLNLIPGTVVDALLWTMYGLFAAISGLAVVCQAKQQWNQLSDGDKTAKPWFVPWQGLAAAIVAFLAWGAAVPGTIFARVPGYQTWMGLVAVVVITLVLNLFDGTFTAAPKAPKPPQKQQPLVVDAH